MAGNFEELWSFIVKRSADANMVVVQDKAELEYIFGLVSECSSYLEVGTAEGNSLYVLANALPKGSDITYIDWAESHTEDKRNFILNRLGDYNVTPIHSDSNDFKTMEQVRQKRFDAVVIDAGHDEFNVAIDALFYGPLANKYIIFHDIQLPDVNRVFEWYAKQRPDCRTRRIVNSKTFGYGVLEL